MSVIRNRVNGILDVVDILLAAAEGGMEQETMFQAMFTDQIMPAFESLNRCKAQLEQAAVDSTKHEGKSSAKMFSQSLPPLAFQTAREAKDLTARAERVMLEEKRSDGEDFS